VRAGQGRRAHWPHAHARGSCEESCDRDGLTATKKMTRTKSRKMMRGMK
jgi:hypothetical protein